MGVVERGGVALQGSDGALVAGAAICRGWAFLEGGSAEEATGN